jgi:hypothetical protein
MLRSPEESALDEDSGVSMLSNEATSGGAKEFTLKELSTAVPWYTEGDWRFDDDGD